MIDKLAPLRVALLGYGTVGSHVARILTTSTDLPRFVGRDLVLVGVAVKNLDKPRVGIDRSLLTDDPASLANQADIVVELMGGIEPARSVLLDAMNHGASIVTANKALLAAHGPELFAAAEKADVDLYYEAAVAGAIPIIRPLRESLVGDEITSIKGIVNGTTNFILDQMSNSSLSFSDAFAIAKDLGWVEADPAADVEGFDAAAKASLLASLAFHAQISGEDVDREGITRISADDIATARHLGYVVKLLAVAEPLESDPNKIAVQVRPAIIPTTHPLASVHGGNNAIVVEARNAGRLTFLGPGAGGAQTASAVVADVAAVARNCAKGIHFSPVLTASSRVAADIAESTDAFFISMAVNDSSGVLARISSAFANHDVSITTVHQRPSHEDESRVLVAITTHKTRCGAVRSTIRDLEEMTDIVHGEIRLYRVEEN